MRWAQNALTSAAIRLASLALTGLGVAACRDATEPPRPAVPRPAFNVVGQITVTDLGTLGGDVSSRAFAINALGQVAGFSSSTSLGEHAFFWANGTMQALGTLGGYYSAATAMNDLGQVVGSSATASTDFHAFLWANGVMQDLGVLGGGLESRAIAINDLGQIVGSSTTASGGGSMPFSGRTARYRTW